MTICLRPAVQEDLPLLTRIWLRAEQIPDEVSLRVPTVLLHMSTTGMLVVAEVNGMLAGFGSSFIRSNVRFMGQLFIDPGEQSAGVGRALMEAVMPHDGAELSTVASPDRRAVSLYTRHGMFPLWPVYGLSAEKATIRSVPDSDVVVVPGGPEVVQLDAEIGGRHRPEDLDYLTTSRGGMPLRFERDGRTIGYGYLQVMRESADELDDLETVRIGPLGVHEASDMTDCIRAAMRAALELGSKVSVLTPGPGDAFRELLDLGFQIRFGDTFMSANRPPFVDALRYIPGTGGMY